MDLQTGRLEDGDHTRIFFFIIYYEGFLNFFLNQLFQKIFCVLV